MDAIPTHARTQVANRLGGESPRDHFQDAFERRRRQGPIRIGLANEVEEVANVPIIDGDAGDDLLRQDVQAVIGNMERLNRAGEHGPNKSGGFE